MRALAVPLVLLLAWATPAAAAPPTGRLAVEVSVEGAEIYIDGTLVARSPISGSLRLRVGSHSLKVSKPGHAEFLDVVKILKDETVTVTVDLIPFAASVTVHSQPPGAYVFVDDKAVGRTPFEGEIDPGPHVVRLTLDGYLDGERSLELVAGESYRVSLTLVASRPPPARRRSAPVYRKWWFWAAAAGAVAAGVTATVVLSGGEDPLADADKVISPRW